MRRVLYYKEKLTAQSTPIQFSSTSHFFFQKSSPPFASKLANKVLRNSYKTQGLYLFHGFLKFPDLSFPCNLILRILFSQMCLPKFQNIDLFSLTILLNLKVI